MKISISIATVILILSSCATSNYGKLKYSKVETNNNNDLASSQITEEKATIEEGQETILSTDSLTNLKLEASTSKDETIKTKVVSIQQQESSRALRSKLNISKNKMFSELDAFQELKSDVEPEEVVKEDNKFAKIAVLMGGLSFIPVVGWIFSILAMVMGGIAISLYKKYPNKYEGTVQKAIVGIVLGIVSLIIGSIIVLVTLIL